LKNQINATTIDSLLFRATRKPQLNGNLQTNYAPVINDFGYDAAITNGHTVSGLVSVNKKIFGKNQIQSQSETFKLLKESLLLNKKLL